MWAVSSWGLEEAETEWMLWTSVMHFEAPLTQLVWVTSVVSVALTYTGGLQGTGDTRSPLYISIVSQIVVPLGLCAVLQATGGLTASGIWLAIVLGHVTRCGLSVLRFRQGRWRSIRVEVGGRPGAAP